MQKVVFSWMFPLEESGGGVERVTSRLISGLSDIGYQCEFILHDVDTGEYFSRGAPIKCLDTYLSDQCVDVFINQNGYSDRISRDMQRFNWRGRYIVCFHNEPYFLLKVFDFRGITRRLFDRSGSLLVRISWLARLLAWPIWRYFSLNKIAETQAINYQTSDAYVVLSSEFIPEVQRLLRTRNLPKLVSIPNPLSFESSEIGHSLEEKERIVLIVSRLNDDEKRISLALKAWESFELTNRSQWKLQIAGDGPDLQHLKRMAGRMRLNRIEFLGKVDPLPLYQNASVFLMTSRVEGWGLTITEAMQNGVVPIAMNAYASLSEIIQHEENGIIIDDGDTKMLTSSLHELTSNHAKRNRLATNAIRSVQQFRLDRVLDKWSALIKR